MENTGKTKWVMDPAHSEISFRVKHLMISNVKGVFKEFEAVVYTTGNNFITPDIEFRLNTASIDTGSPDRDTHLKSADFFDSDKFKQILFVGKLAEKTDDEGNFTLIGELTIKDITKQVKLDVEFGGIMKDPWGNEKAGFTVTGKINRKDWELNWNAALETGGVLVSDEVKLSCDVQLIKHA